MRAGSRLCPARYLLQRQQHELLGLGHVHEVLQHIPVGRLEQVAARVCVGKAPDAQAVGWVELTEQKLAAGVTDTVQLQEAGGREQGLRGQRREGWAMETVEWEGRKKQGGPARRVLGG